MPALLKAFLEQVMRPRVALKYRKPSFPRGLLAGRLARLVVTMRAGADLQMVRPGTWSPRARTQRPQLLRHDPSARDLLGMVDAASGAKRQGWLDRMRDYGRRLI